MKNVSLKSVLLIIIPTLAFLVSYHITEINKLNKQYLDAKNAYLEKSELAFRYALYDWKKADSLITTLEQINKSGNKDYMKTRGLIDEARKQADKWNAQITNLIHLSDLPNQDKLTFQRLNDFWLSSNKQSDLIIENRSINNYILRKISFLYWQTKEIDPEMIKTLDQLINNLKEIDKEVELIQQSDRTPFLFESSDGDYLQRQFIEKVGSQIHQIRILAEEFNHNYLGQVIIIEKDDTNKKFKTVFGDANPNKDVLSILVSDKEIYDRYQIGEKIAVWYKFGESNRDIIPTKIQKVN